MFDLTSFQWSSKEGGTTGHGYPPPRDLAASVYLTDKLVLVGGEDSHGNFLNDVWMLDLAPDIESDPTITTPSNDKDITEAAKIHPLVLQAWEWELAKMKAMEANRNASSKPVESNSTTVVPHIKRGLGKWEPQKWPCGTQDIPAASCEEIRQSAIAAGDQGELVDAKYWLKVSAKLTC